MADLGALRYACQTYSWQMSIDIYRGRIDHMVAAAARSGFAGFEPELVMLGHDWTISAFKDTLQAHEIELAALVLAEPWQGAVENVQEKADADLVITAASAIPGSKIVLCPLPGPDRTTMGRSELYARQSRAMACVEAVARRAAEAGVACSFHPNSPPGSLFRTSEDYQRMADLLPALIGYTPDVGHIAKGGMDPLIVLQEWRERVDHLHVKDLAADGTWAQSGAGTVDIPGVLHYLSTTEYRGWVTFEDESPQAEAHPDLSAAKNGHYLQQLTRAQSGIR